jgi:hypothetical protein
MNHRATPRFWACYRRLPEEIQQLADRCYELLLQDTHHPSLHFKEMATRNALDAPEMQPMFKAGVTVWYKYFDLAIRRVVPEQIVVPTEIGGR